MELNEKLRELVAVGASVTANCQPCLQLHVEKALGAGASPCEVAAAIEVGNRVRKGAAAKMEAFSARLLTGEVPAAGTGTAGGCCDLGKAVSAEVVVSANGRDFLGP